MAAQANARPIIKRKKVVKGDGHHGGAWKVAYADFVTAMMAFFMLMWLLGATTEKQRKGIADYFNPTIPINRISGGGEGAFGGESVFSEQTMAQSGTGAGLNRPTEERRSRGASGTDDGDRDETEAQATKEVVDAALLALSGDSTIRDLIRRHIVTRVSDQGLVIELFDRADAPLFEADTDIPRPELLGLLPALVETMALVVNDVALEAHVRAAPVVVRTQRAWDLSTDRADALRRLLQAQGLPASRVQRITGFGDRRPVAADPMAPRNSRIELILLRDVP